MWIGHKTRRRADGTEYESRKYYFRVTVDGRTVERAGTTDLTATRRMAAKVERDMLLGELEPAARVRAARRTPLEAWVEEHVRHLAANGTGEGQQAAVRGHLAAAFDAMGARRVADVTTEAVEGHLLEMVSVAEAEDEGPRTGRTGVTGPKPRRRGLSYKTRNHRLAVLKHFCTWLVSRGALRESPVAWIRPLTVERDPGHGTRRRRALTEEELRRLVEAARRRPLEAYRANHGRVPAWKAEALRLKGLERAAVYLVGARAGLRRQELKKLRWEDVRWSRDGRRGEIVVRAGSAKNKREETVPLFDVVEAALRGVMEARFEVRGRWPEGAVFEVVNEGLLDAMRDDLAAAGIPVATADGRVDVHALRTTCGTWLAERGVQPAVAQRMLRHRHSATTMRFYTRVSEQLLRLEMERVEGGAGSGQASGPAAEEGGR